MPSYRLLHCADLHLDSPLRGLEADPDAPAERIRGATREAFVNLVNYAIDQRVAVVLIAGDIFDGDWQDVRTSHFLVRQLERLTSNNIRVVAISGNHDADSVISRKMPWPDGAQQIKADRPYTVSFDDLSLTIHGQGFARRDVRENLAASYLPRVEGHLNIGLLHTAANTGGGDHQNYAACSLDDLINRRYDYWALGHIHKRTELLSGDPCWAIFPGNLQGRHIREAGAKGATLITVEHDRIAGAPEHKDFDVVRWAEIRVDLTGAGDEDAAHAMIREQVRAARAEAGDRLLAARVVLTGATATHAALLRDSGHTRDRIYGEALAGGFGGSLWLEKLVILTQPAGQFMAGDDMVDVLRRQIDGYTGEEFVSGLQGYAKSMLEKAGGITFLEEADPGNPVAKLADGVIDPALMEQARALLRAALDA